MVTEDYVNRETYRLLKESGFDGETHTTYDSEGYTQPSITLQTAVKWLREEHGLYIGVEPTWGYVDAVGDDSEARVVGWECTIGRLDGKALLYRKTRSAYPEEAFDYAIRQCLEHLARRHGDMTL